MSRRETTIRYLCAATLAVVGGIAGPLAANVWDVNGLGAYGLFLAGAAIFCLPATVLTGQIPPGARTRAAGVEHPDDKR